jgi:hypothetical protein
MQLARLLLLGVHLYACGACLPALSTNANTRAEVPQAEPATAESEKSPPKLDRRYAIARGSWSAATVSLFNTWSALDDNPGRHMSFYSPDRRKRIEVVGAKVTLRMSGRSFKTDINTFTKHDAELGWAPDSARFFVTWTQSGELGPWHMQVYGVNESGVHEFPNVEAPARKDVEQRVRRWPIDPALNSPDLRSVWNADQYCEPYHVIGGRWLNGSQELLLSVLIRNTSDCKYMSEFNVYRVNAVSGEILERFTAAEAHKRFGDKYLPLIAR